MAEPEHIISEEDASWDYADIWDKFPVPARPSREELNYLEKEILAKGNNVNVLILGSTIEYRSLVKKLGISATVVDFSRSIYTTLTKYSHESFDHETFVELDWLEVDYVDAYDVILGHRIFNVIGKGVVQNMFERMYAALKAGGVYYCKGNVQFTNESDKLDALVNEWAYKENRIYPLFSYIEVALYFHCADKNGYVDYTKARTVVNGWIEKKRISKEDYDLISILVSLSDEARFRGLVLEDELKDILKNIGFNKIDWVFLDKDICSNMPIIRLEK